MTGCANAIAERDRLRALCPPLAYDLHLRPGFRCRRAGGDSQCGTCAGDVLPSDMPHEAISWPLNGVKTISAVSQRVDPKNAPRATVGEI